MVVNQNTKTDKFIHAVPQHTTTCSMAEVLHKPVTVGHITVRPTALIGEGGFAYVFRAATDTGQEYALKRVLCGDGTPLLAQMRAEIGVMNEVRGHPNVVQLVAFSETRLASRQCTEVCLLMELVPGGNVGELMVEAINGPAQSRLMAKLIGSGNTGQRDAHIPAKSALSLFAAAASAVAYLHSASPPIAHRDIKAENILLKKRRGATPLAALADTVPADFLLCDFGSTSTEHYTDGEALWAQKSSSEILSEILSNTTPAYRAPELLDRFACYPVTEKVDVWALGVLLFFCAYGSLPFGESGNGAMSGRYTAPAHLKNEQVEKYLKLCFVKDPNERMCAADIVDELRKDGFEVQPARRSRARATAPAASPVESGTPSAQGKVLDLFGGLTVAQQRPEPHHTPAAQSALVDAWAAASALVGTSLESPASAGMAGSERQGSSTAWSSFSTPQPQVTSPRSQPLSVEDLLSLSEEPKQHKPIAAQENTGWAQWPAPQPSASQGGQWASDWASKTLPARVSWGDVPGPQKKNSGSHRRSRSLQTAPVSVNSHASQSPCSNFIEGLNLFQ